MRVARASGTLDLDLRRGDEMEVATIEGPTAGCSGSDGKFQLRELRSKVGRNFFDDGRRIPFGSGLREACGFIEIDG